MVQIYCTDLDGVIYSAITLDQAVRIHLGQETIPEIPEDCDKTNFRDALRFAEHYLQLPVIDNGLPCTVQYRSFLEQWESVLRHVFTREKVENANLVYIQPGEKVEGEHYTANSSNIECFGRGRCNQFGGVEDVLYLKTLSELPQGYEMLKRGFLFTLSSLILYEAVP